MPSPIQVAVLIPDNRDEFRQYDRPQPVFGSAPEALLSGLAETPGVEVHVVACTQQPLAAPAKIAENILYHSLRVPKLGWLRTGYQGCIRAVRRKLRGLRPDVVHGQGTERYCALAAVLSGFPNVVTIHGNMRSVARVDGARPFSFLWCAARLERFTLPRTDGVVCITTYTQQLVASLARRTWVVPNAVDASFFEVRPGSSVDPVLVCAGQICLRKNQNALIRALDPLARQRRFKIVFLGGIGKGDPYGEEFKKLIVTRPWCEYAGFADRQQLQEHLRDATLLVLPSLEDNCPMVVLEAMAASVPVAAAEVGGVPDLVSPGRTGALFDPTKAVSMREALGALLLDPALRLRCAATAREEALRRFAPKSVAMRHLEIYREVINGAP